MDINDLIGVLVEQNKSFIEQNKSYKEMLYWAVGSIITLLVIFLTANFLTMRKMRKDEIERIKMEVVQGIKETSMPDIEKQLKDQLTELVEDKLGSFESKLNSFDSRLQSLTNKQSRQVSQFDEQFYELRGDFYYLEGEVFILDQIYENAFESFLNAGNKYIEADSPGHLYGVLNMLENTAVKLSYVASEVSDIAEFGKKIDDKYEHQINKIIDILNTKRRLRSMVDDLDN